MSRKNCVKERIKVDLPCSHCQDLLNRKSWIYEERVLECSVCRKCQEKCWKEWDKMQSLRDIGEQTLKERRDSMLAGFDAVGLRAFAGDNLRKARSEKQLREQTDTAVASTESLARDGLRRIDTRLQAQALRKAQSEEGLRIVD